VITRHGETRGTKSANRRCSPPIARRRHHHHQTNVDDSALETQCAPWEAAVRVQAGCPHLDRCNSEIARAGTWSSTRELGCPAVSSAVHADGDRSWRGRARWAANGVVLMHRRWPARHPGKVGVRKGVHCSESSGRYGRYVWGATCGSSATTKAAMALATSTRCKSAREREEPTSQWSLTGWCWPTSMVRV
jgi:hypothetical protein